MVGQPRSKEGLEFAWSGGGGGDIDCQINCWGAQNQSPPPPPRAIFLEAPSHDRGYKSTHIVGHSFTQNQGRPQAGETPSVTMTK